MLPLPANNMRSELGRWVPVRFLLFAGVGALGVPVHLAVLALLYRLGPAGFVPGQAAAALAAMTTNFALNNELTYRDVRLRGWRWLMLISNTRGTPEVLGLRAP